MRAARQLAFTLALLAAAMLAHAHPAPNSILRFDFGASSVRAEMWVPKSELAFATAADPGEPGLPAYLLRHLAAETATGQRWRTQVTGVRETTYLDHEYFVADLELTPPAGTPAATFTLVTDSITHEVRNHVVFVVVRNEPEQPRFVGTLQYPVRRLAVAPNS
jgi:hypothetical protein